MLCLFPVHTKIHGRRYDKTDEHLKYHLSLSGLELRLSCHTEYKEQYKRYGDPGYDYSIRKKNLESVSDLEIMLPRKDRLIDLFADIADLNFFDEMLLERLAELLKP